MQAVDTFEEVAVVRGTAKQLMEMKLKINDQSVDNVGLSVLAKYGIAKVVGMVEKIDGQRGRPACIYQIDASNAVVLEILE